MASSSSTTSLPGPRDLPGYLAGREDEWLRDPRAAQLGWFKQARYGLFLHYGVYSLLGRGEWVQFRENVPVAEYERLIDRFSAERFDASAICDLALDAGMRYVNITTRHHDSFCLWDTATTAFNSKRAPARRDLVRELAEACHARGLALFLYYSHGRDWRHPYFPPNTVLDHTARPDYAEPQPEYKWETDADTERYVQYCHAQLTELLSAYGPIAGIWFDGVATWRRRPDLFHVEDTYALVRRLQPGCLIAYKNGAIDQEDFYSPEHSLDWGGGLRGDPNRFAEINTSMHKLWGNYQGEDAAHKGPDEVERIVRGAWSEGANLLLNTGPLGDGSIHPDDERTLREVGRRLRAS
jgi:alpha-L-fucosidase